MGVSISHDATVAPRKKTPARADKKAAPTTKQPTDAGRGGRGLPRVDRGLDPDFDVHLGAALRTLRKQAGVRQEDIAGAIGVSDRAISKRERGESVITVNELVALTRFLGVHVDHALRLAGVASPPWSMEEMIRSDPALTPLWRNNLLLDYADAVAVSRASRAVGEARE